MILLFLKYEKPLYVNYFKYVKVLKLIAASAINIGIKKNYLRHVLITFRTTENVIIKLDKKVLSGKESQPKKIDSSYSGRKMELPRITPLTLTF